MTADTNKTENNPDTLQPEEPQEYIQTIMMIAKE
jgi:hypothetical protein